MKELFAEILNMRRLLAGIWVVRGAVREGEVDREVLVDLVHDRRARRRDAHL